MTARRHILLGLAGLAACSSGPPPATVVKIALNAGKSVNPDAVGTAQPVRVRVFRLAAAQGFGRADYFSLDADAKAVLGKDLLGFDDVVVSPGGSVAYQRTCEPDTQAVGLAAAFATLDGTKWRASAPVKPNKTNPFTVTLENNEMTLKAAGDE